MLNFIKLIDALKRLAEKLAAKTEFKSEHASSNDAARYHFYLGRIYAIQLRYAEAFSNLEQAIRKGPRRGARGFRSIVCPPFASVS